MLCEWPTTSHIALDLIQVLTRLLYDNCQVDWTTLTTHQQISFSLGDPPSSLSKKFHYIWSNLTLPAILHCVSQLENLLFNIK